MPLYADKEAAVAGRFHAIFYSKGLRHMEESYLLQGDRRVPNTAAEIEACFSPPFLLLPDNLGRALPSLSHLAIDNCQRGLNPILQKSKPRLRIVKGLVQVRNPVAELGRRSQVPRCSFP